jgi:hypothetical protein
MPQTIDTMTNSKTTTPAAMDAIVGWSRDSNNSLIESQRSELDSEKDKTKVQL